MPYRTRILPPRPRWVILWAKIRLLDHNAKVYRRGHKLAVHVTREGAARVVDFLKIVMGRDYKVVRFVKGGGFITLTRKSIAWRRGQWGTINKAPDHVNASFGLLKRVDLARTTSDQLGRFIAKRRKFMQAVENTYLTNFDR